MKTYFSLLALLLLLTIAACTPSDTEPEARRTLLVYMGGHNNLSYETAEKIDSLSAGWNNATDNLLIYQDTEQGPSRLIRLLPGGKMRTVSTYEVENSASAEVLRRVVDEVLTDFPAQEYGLLVFSHGTSWLPQGAYASPRSIIVDRTDEMEIADFAAALPDHRFGFIIFESCLMAGIEVAYELRHKADYILASSAEILIPGFTPIYPRLRDYLFEPQANLTAFAAHYYNYWNEQTGIKHSATISLIRTAGLEEFAAFVRPLMRNGVPDPLPAKVQHFDSTTDRTLFFDLGHYLSLRAGDVPVERIASEVEKVVVWKAATPKFMYHPIEQHCGLTVYIPQTRFPGLNEAHLKTVWSVATR